MPEVHRDRDARSCGASTNVVGNRTVYTNELLTSVYGDTNSHGGGALLATVNPGTVFIHNLEMVVVGSEANCDALLHCGGGDASASGSPNVYAFDGNGEEEDDVSCENDPTPLPDEVIEEPTVPVVGGAVNPDPLTLPAEPGGPFVAPSQVALDNAPQNGRDAVVRGGTDDEPEEERVARGLDPNRGLNSELGSLSSRYESNGNPGAIGNDRTGGFSYGEYQIATNTGTMDAYMNYLRVNSPRTYSQLQAAGGADAARRGSAGFQSAWQTLMANPEHSRTQHDFIQATHYMPGAVAVQNRTGIDLATRSQTLRDVAWSTSVQHGGSNRGIGNVWANAGVNSNMTDEQIIRAVYAERGRRNANGELKYFSSSNASTQASVANRFVNEQADALAALAAEQG